MLKFIVSFIVLKTFFLCVKKVVEWGGTPNATGRGANGMLGMLTEAHVEVVKFVTIKEGGGSTVSLLLRKVKYLVDFGS